MSSKVNSKPNVKEAILFGSRTKGTDHPESEIDSALIDRALKVSYKKPSFN